MPRPHGKRGLVSGENADLMAAYAPFLLAAIPFTLLRRLGQDLLMGQSCIWAFNLCRFLETFFPFLLFLVLWGGDRPAGDGRRRLRLVRGPGPEHGHPWSPSPAPGSRRPGRAWPSSEKPGLQLLMKLLAIGLFLQKKNLRILPFFKMLLQKILNKTFYFTQIFQVV